VQTLPPEVKSLLDDFQGALNVIIGIEALRQIVSRFIKKFYDKGLEAQEVKFNVNFTRNEETIKFLENSTFERVKGINAELRARLQAELSAGLAANESRGDLRNRISSVFKGDNPTRFRFEDRIEMIRRTETNRAENLGGLDAARQLPGLVKKYLNVKRDARTSPICIAMDAKYGKESQAIPLNDKFTVTVKIGKKTQTISEVSPPFHVNERTSIRYVTVEED